MFEASLTGAILAIQRPESVWLSTGWRGGRRVADAAYSVTVPDGWHPDDLGVDVADRLSAAGVVDLPADEIGRAAPILLTGVDAENARGARLGSVEAYATAGVSNLAELPMDPEGTELPGGGDEDRPIGTVNLVVGTTAALSEGALANLVAVAAEAKAATLLSAIGAPGTTSDAVVVACDPSGPKTTFSGSATTVGNAARACVREAVQASLAARYDENPPPTSVDRVEYGVVTDGRAEVFSPE